MQSRTPCVKCQLNGELSVGRRIFPRFGVRIPLLHTGEFPPYVAHGSVCRVQPLWVHAASAHIFKEGFVMPKVKSFFSPRRLASMAIFIALQIVIARFAGIQVSEGLRISFEAIPIILAGIWLGPMSGFLVGFLSDFIGTIIGGYGVYFPPLAITPILNGVLPGLCYRYLFKENMNYVKCITMIVITEMLSSLLLGTYALTWYFHLFVPNKQATFALLLIPRLAKFLTIICDAIIVWLVHRTAYKRAIAPVLAQHV